VSVPNPLPATDSADGKRVVRIWMDGAFDMMHYGHVNAFRQGRSLGTHLVVGVNDDSSITTCKGGPPVMNDAERLAMVEGCKFVDEVVPNVPYVMSPQYIQWAITTYRIDYVVHGDDPCIVDGQDVYEVPWATARTRIARRTPMGPHLAPRDPTGGARYPHPDRTADRRSSRPCATW